MTTKRIPYRAVTPDTSFGMYSDAFDRPCLGMCEAPCNMSLRSAYGWPLSNGSQFYASQFYAAGNKKCPESFMMQLAPGISTANVTDHVYAYSGIAVDRTAIGAPTTIFSGEVFQSLSSHYGGTLVSTTQCVPVMVSNPVSPSLVGEEHVGKMLLGFGAVNGPVNQVPYASYLAGTISNRYEPEYRAGGSKYAVTCVVNPRNVFEYRLVTLDLRALGKGSNLAQYLTGGETCTPTEPTISNKLFAMAGIASKDLVQEHQGVDGYVETLVEFSGQYRKPPYAFQDSRNALEDVLGLVSALAVSKMVVIGYIVLASALNDRGGDSSALIKVTRLGTDSSEALWLLIPPAGSLIIICVLSFLSFRRNWAPVGRGFEGISRQRPNRYAAESLYQIISLGISTKRISQED
ncbi:uncharacterized protein F4822DRAFT_444066 [Hypoxylon trugodes]|uniref:uncharacterized protein n=1 Tax=Hypoxylon trugodes TaxID=326681 RepID=UPI00219DA620|nr:uncharacterized protein F4822DRAFT_444066 [Hypoxylon trugodes]KAI1387299.1 hypothetical protein F4822DRAFT_444066 [Hypoxylon trugodes]